jgi:hypothetical protein
MAFTKHLKRRQRKMTQKVRKWLKRRGLRGGSGNTPVPDEAAAKAAQDAAVQEAAAKAAQEAAEKDAAAKAAAAAANNVVVKSPNDSNTSNDTLVPDADADAINNGVVKKLEVEPEDITASSDKQETFRNALLKAQEAVNTALTAYS